MIGANPTVNHPVAATFIKNAAKRGAKLIVMDPRRQALSRHATMHLHFKPGSRRRDAERDAPHHHHRGADRPAIHRRLHRGLRRPQGAHQGFPAGEDGADLRHSGRDPARSGADVCALARLAHLLGHGHQPAHPRHRQCALPDRAGADHRPDRPSRHRAASAARPEQRAGRLRRRPDPDVLAGLPAGRAAPICASRSKSSGIRRSIRCAASPWSRS